MSGCQAILLALRIRKKADEFTPPYLSYTAFGRGTREKIVQRFPLDRFFCEAGATSVTGTEQQRERGGLGWVLVWVLVLVVRRASKRNTDVGYMGETVV